VTLPQSLSEDHYAG